MPVAAITGNLCSGKSTVLKLFKEKGVETLSADELVHACYRNKEGNVYKKIRENFPNVFDKNGNISRKKLARIVFTSRSSLKKLERIVHPEVIKYLKEWVASKRESKSLCAAEVPLLFEKGLDKFFDIVIFVDASRPNTIKRAAHKFGISQEEAEARIANFIPASVKKKKSHFIISNNSSIYELNKKVGVVWRKLVRTQ